jgi:hypothetical protein
MIKIHHFYHIYAADHGTIWKPVVKFHIDMLKKHGLMKRLKTVHIGIIGAGSNRQEVLNYLRELDFPHTIVDESRSGWEQVTQNKLHDFAQLNDGYVLYAHTKGCANPSELSVNWRNAMTYHNIVKWKKAIKKLKNHDAVGCYWIDASTDDPPPSLGAPHLGQRWFAGTFWWSKLELIRQIPPPQNASRWDAEVWIGKIPNIKVFDLAANSPAGDIIDPSLF